MAKHRNSRKQTLGNVLHASDFVGTVVDLPFGRHGEDDEEVVFRLVFVGKGEAGVRSDRQTAGEQALGRRRE